MAKTNEIQGGTCFMLGAIIGDVVGSRFEFNNIKTKEFDLITNESTFTDDTVLTIAVMDWSLNAEIKNEETITKYFQKWARKYPNSGFGGRFSREWLWNNNPKPYNSKGNGSGMRISPVAYIANNKDELFNLADIVTKVTHNHREGIKGARVIAYATYLALHGASKDEIREMAESYYPEIASFSYEQLVKEYYFNELAETTCPQAVYCFLISKNFEDCLRTSVSIGGDTDTLCAMSCAIAEAYYGRISLSLIESVRNKLPQEMLTIIDSFKQKFVGNGMKTSLRCPNCGMEYPYNFDDFIDVAKDRSLYQTVTCNFLYPGPICPNCKKAKTRVTSCIIANSEKGFAIVWGKNQQNLVERHKEKLENLSVFSAGYLSHNVLLNVFNALDNGLNPYILRLTLKYYEYLTNELIQLKSIESSITKVSYDKSRSDYIDDLIIDVKLSNDIGFEYPFSSSIYNKLYEKFISDYSDQMNADLQLNAEVEKVFKELCGKH